MVNDYFAHCFGMILECALCFEHLRCRGSPVHEKTFKVPEIHLD